jgi:hypothetical protein
MCVLLSFQRDRDPTLPWAEGKNGEMGTAIDHNAPHRPALGNDGITPARRYQSPASLAFAESWWGGTGRDEPHVLDDVYSRIPVGGKP